MRYQSFKEFYPFYLAQHKDPVCRNYLKDKLAASQNSSVNATITEISYPIH
ncbi:Mpo1-like protein [Shewanella benthica]|uniref:Mpo1-like protein n=1 Tax=Shewanella benthica TaxID=43661 RepID=UPI003B21E4A7